MLITAVRTTPIIEGRDERKKGSSMLKGGCDDDDSGTTPPRPFLSPRRANAGPQAIIPQSIMLQQPPMQSFHSRVHLNVQSRTIFKFLNQCSAIKFSPRPPLNIQPDMRKLRIHAHRQILKHIGSFSHIK